MLISNQTAKKSRKWAAISHIIIWTCGAKEQDFGNLDTDFTILLIHFPPFHWKSPLNIGCLRSRIFLFSFDLFLNQKSSLAIPVCQKRGRQHGFQSLLICEGFASSLHATQRMCSFWRSQPVNNNNKNYQQNLYCQLFIKTGWTWVKVTETDMDVYFK